MSDGIVPSMLKFLGRPNKVVLNALNGNWEGAGRQLLDIGGDAIDALIPGDWIPEASREQDSPEFSDVVGGMEPGWKKTAVDILGGMATDPLTYVGAGPFIKGAKLGLGAAVKGAAKVAPELTEQAVKTAGNLGHEVRAATGNLKVSEPLANTLAEAGGKGSATSKAAQGFAVPAFQGVAPDIQEKATLLLNDIYKDQKGLANTLGVRPGMVGFGRAEEQAALIDQRLAKLPWDEATKQQVREAATKGSEYSRTMWKQGVEDAVFQQPEMWQRGSRPLPQEHVEGLYGESKQLMERNASKAETKAEQLKQRLARFEAKTQELRPLYDAAANEAVAASTKADDLFERLGDLASRKKTVDALDAKITRWQGATDALGSMVESSGTRNAGLQQRVLDAKDTIAKSKAAFAAYKKAMLGGATDAELEPLRLAAKGAAGDAAQLQSELISVAKSGEFGQIAGAYDAWTQAKSAANQARKAIKDAVSEGRDADEIAKLKADYDRLSVQVDAAKRSLKTLNPRLSESSLYDDRLTGRLATKQGKLRELRTLMGQLDDPDLARVGQMTKSAYRASGAGSAAERQAVRAFSRLKRYEGKISDIADVLPGVESAAKHYRDIPSLENWARQEGLTFGKLPSEMAPLDYIPRRTDIESAASEFAKTGGIANPLKARTRTPEDLANALNAGETLDTNIPKLLGDYGAQMGRATEAAAIGKKLAPDAFKALSDDKSRAAIRDLIKTMREAGKADDAMALETAFQGLPPREGFWKLMAGLNSIFKPAATGGAGIPKIGFNVRNALSGAVQIGMDDGFGAGMSALKRTPQVLAGAFGDGLRQLGLKIPENARIAQIEDAVRASGGSREKMLAAISDPVVKQAVEHGVIDHGFVSSEKMAETLANAGPKNWKTWRDMPSHIVQGVEQRMRLGRFEELLNQGKSAAEAAKITSGNLYDYAYSSLMNRKLRDIIPFAQYTFKAVPQSAKFLASGTPLANATLSGMSHLSSVTDENQVYPWMEGRLNIPLGANDQGDNNFISGLGLPMESLAQIPNLSGSPRSIGRELERNVVASTQPVLKTAYGLISGHDPFSQQPTMAYDKIPVIGSAGEAGRMYNLSAGTGLLQPIDSPIRTVDKMLDSRRDLMTRALDVGTGANVVSVDPNRAQQMQISAELEQNPQVSQYRGFYQGGVKDPEIQAKLDAMKAAGKASRAEVKAAAAPAETGPKRMFKAKTGSDGLAQSFGTEGVDYKVTRALDGGIQYVTKSDGTRLRAQRDNRGRITGLIPDGPTSPF